MYFGGVLQLRQEHTRELDELVQQAGASGGLGGVGAREMVGELNERINVLMAENTVMADQVSTSYCEVVRCIIFRFSMKFGKVLGSRKCTQTDSVLRAEPPGLHGRSKSLRNLTGWSN